MFPNGSRAAMTGSRAEPPVLHWLKEVLMVRVSREVVEEKVGQLKRATGTPGGRVIPRGARWWLVLPLAAVALFIVAGTRR